MSFDKLSVVWKSNKLTSPIQCFFICSAVGHIERWKQTEMTTRAAAPPKISSLRILCNFFINGFSLMAAVANCYGYQLSVRPTIFPTIWYVYAEYFIQGFRVAFFGSTFTCFVAQDNDEDRVEYDDEELNKTRLPPHSPNLQSMASLKKDWKMKLQRQQHLNVSKLWIFSSILGWSQQRT